MVELIAVSILIICISGIAVIMYRKIPVLVQLSETPIFPNFKSKIQKIKEKIKNFKSFKVSSFEILLQKILSKIRILTLKIESKTSSWLQKLRKKSQTKKENDQYWQKIKESIEEDKSENNKNRKGVGET